MITALIHKNSRDGTSPFFNTEGIVYVTANTEMYPIYFLPVIPSLQPLGIELIFL